MWLKSFNYIVREQWQLHIFEKYKYEKVICIKQLFQFQICNFAKEHLSKEQKDDQATKSI